MDTIKDRLTSRRFWLVVIVGILVIANEALALGISQESLVKIVGLSGIYVIGDSYEQARS